MGIEYCRSPRWPLLECAGGGLDHTICEKCERWCAAKSCDSHGPRNHDDGLRCDERATAIASPLWMPCKTSSACA